MKRYFAPLVVTLALVVAHCFAREPQAPPSPSADAGSAQVGTIKTVPHPSGYGATSFFLGHYGEAIEIRYDWSPEAELRGATEVVYFHRKFSDDNSLHPFQPKAADYKLENFSRLELMELVVIPKNAPGGLRSLKAIRLAKESEMARNGVDYKIVDENNEYAWPRGTFHVRTMQPYRVVQTYGESPKEFYILTTGGYVAAGDYGLSEKRASDYNHAAERALESLRQHLLAVHKKSFGEYLSAFAPETSGYFSFVPAPERSSDFLSSFKTMRFRAVYGTLGAAMLVLAFWPGASPRARRAHLFGWSLFLFAHSMAMVGFLSVYVPVRFGGITWRSSEDATLLPVLLIPSISWFAARRLGSARAKRVLISTGVLAALWTALVVLTRRSESPLPVEFVVLGNTATLHLMGMIFGTAFALAFGPLSKKAGIR